MWVVREIQSDRELSWLCLQSKHEHTNMWYSGTPPPCSSLQQQCTNHPDTEVLLRLVRIKMFVLLFSDSNTAVDAK